MAKKWYIVHTHTGFEVKVKTTLEDNIRQAGQGDFFGDILVPTEQVVEMVKGERKTSERKFFPGYILVQMEMNASFVPETSFQVMLRFLLIISLEISAILFSDTVGFRSSI